MKSATRVSTVFLVVFTFIALQIFLEHSIAGSRAMGIQKVLFASTQPTSQAVVSVKIENFSFLPRKLEVAIGTTVTWQNADDVPHTATSKGEPQVFDSGPLDTDDKFSFTFSKAGEFAYYCKVHPHMTGVVIVK